MNTLQAISTRASVRSFTDEIVDKSTTEQLIRAAMCAPSAHNRQPWEFVVLRDRATLDSLASELTYAKMLSQATLAIAVCGRPEVVLPDGSRQSNPRWVQDCSAATQNILLAAHDLGLGAVWTAADDEQRGGVVRRTLSLPEGIEPLCVIAIGHIAAPATPKDKWKPEKVHYEQW